MAHLIFSEGATIPEGPDRDSVVSFLGQLQTDPEASASLLEKPAGAVDKRIRTAHLSPSLSAVVFELRTDGLHQFVYTGAFSTEEAARLATTSRLKVNPVNGVTTLFQEPAAKVAADKIEADESIQVADAVEMPNEETVGAFLEAEGYSQADIAADFAVDEAAVELAWPSTKVEQLNATLAGYPEWMSEVFIGLWAGMSAEQVREDLALDFEIDVAGQPDSDEAIVAGLQHPTAASQFTVVGDDAEELRRVIDKASFAQWQLYLHPSQAKIVSRNYSGAGKITGGAGTGKTVVLMHRANRLISEDPEAAVVLTTFTRALAQSLKHQMEQLNPHYREASDIGEPGLWIGGIDQAISQVNRMADEEDKRQALDWLVGTVGSTKFQPFDSYALDDAWKTAITVTDTDLDRTIANPTFLNDEYEAVVLANKISTLAEYRGVPRPGRGTALNRGQRTKVWQIMEAFRAECSARNKLPFSALGAMAADCVRKQADHVLVDEGQDLHAGHWMFLRALAAPGPNDLFIAEDAHQRIYGQRLVLSRFGIETRGRASAKLLRNYRTTAQNLDFALKILRGETFLGSDGEEDSTEFQRSALQGPKPEIVRCNNDAEQADVAAERIEEWQEEARAQGHEEPVIGVLARTNKRVNRAVAQLTERGIAAASERQGGVPGVSVMAMHNAKGMEFNHVVLIDVDERSVPLPYIARGLGEAETSDAMQRERALLYVAASRARESVLITTGDEPSPFLPEP